MFQTTRIEVLNVMFHFILALVLILVYGILTYTGHPDETLKFCVISAIAFFFGSAATGAVSNALKSGSQPAPMILQPEPPVDPTPTTVTQQAVNNPIRPPNSGV